MADIERDAGRRRRRIRISPILTSAFALSILTAVFFLQGRAYRSGWLGFFGMEHALFPISSGEGYWLTLSGWATTSVRWFNSAWQIYADTLCRYGLLLFVLVMLVIFLEWLKFHRASKVAQDKADDDNRKPPEWIREWLVSGSKVRYWLARAAVALVLVPFSLAVVPMLLFLAGILLATVIALAFVPFENLGKQAAIDFCKRPVSQIARVVLREPHMPDWGYRIECNPDVCAIVRDGRVLIVPMDHVERIELPPLGGTTQPAGAPAQEQLCSTPVDDSAVPP